MPAKTKPVKGAKTSAYGQPLDIDGNCICSEAPKPHAQHKPENWNERAVGTVKKNCTCHPKLRNCPTCKTGAFAPDHEVPQTSLYDRYLARAHELCTAHLHCGTLFGGKAHSPIEQAVAKALVSAFCRGKASG